jgi:anti-sigma regulatory factor (Ser/Thr protein kinase)
MAEAPAAGFSHCALIYRDPADCLAAVLAFVKDGLARDEPVSIAVSGPTSLLLRRAVGDATPGLEFRDMTELGRNPGRILSAAGDFAASHRGQPVRWVAEPLWPGRSAAEVTEAIRCEALLNLALQEAPVSVFCLYDLMRLTPAMTASAEQTHPVVSADGRTQANADYLGPGILPPGCDSPLPPPPGDAVELRYARDLRPVRELVAEQATAAGLSRGRSADLMIAVSEVGANTLKHTGNGGQLLIWRTADEIVCQLHDQGTISDPLAGRRRPGKASSGYGLWVVNQICDLVELRSAPANTVLRLHMRL